MKVPILRLRLPLAAFGWMLLVAGAAGAETSPEDLDLFESKIRPLFVAHCYACHSQDGKERQGGLLLDTRDGVLKGGDSGAAVVPGDPERSLLIKAVRRTDENLQMPPKEGLSDTQIADLVEWVKRGAPDPRKGDAP